MMSARLRGWLVWAGLALAIGLPLFLAATSPLLAWRQPVYIIAGFAGVLCLAMLSLQPLLAAGLLPGMSVAIGRRWHRVLGLALLAAVIIHVAGLWITSPPDVIDALLFRSPTPFSVWGVAAMWAVFLTAGIAVFRTRLGLRWRAWRLVHSVLAVIITGGTIAHAVLIDGTMETVTKWGLCALVAVAALWVLADPATLKRLVAPRR